MNFYKKKLVRLGVYLVLLAAGLFYVALCQAGQGIGCFFYEQFHITCISCGATRALLSLLSLDFSGAASFHPVFALALYPITGILALQDLALCLWDLCTGKNSTSLLSWLFYRRTRRAPSPSPTYGEQL